MLVVMLHVCREKQAPDWEDCKEMHYNVLPKNAIQDFVQGSVLKCITQK